LPISGTPIVRSSVFAFSEEEYRSERVKGLCQELDQALEARHGKERNGELPYFQGLTDEDEEHLSGRFLLDVSQEAREPESPMLSAPEADEYTADAYDNYLSARVRLERGNSQFTGTVKKRAQDASANPIGVANNNPLLDTREYGVEFPDGSVDVLSANVIAESIYASVDEKGHQFVLLKEILDHRSNKDAVSKDDGWIQGTNRKRRTTKGWQLLVE